MGENMDHNEVDKFFGNLPSEDKREQDIFDEKNRDAQVPAASEKKADEDDGGEGRKNRRHRRLEDALQRERDSNIALNERIKVLAEQKSYERESARDAAIDPRLTKVFGDNDVGKEIARSFSEILNDTKEEARERALQEFEERQVQGIQEQRQYESFIDDQLESLEETHNIDLTSDAPKARKARREFLEMVQNLSPKDEDGTITGYADFGATFDQYQRVAAQDKPDASRQKEIAAKSMQRSAQPASAGNQVTPGFRGWQKDYNL